MMDAQFFAEGLSDNSAYFIVLINFCFLEKLRNLFICMQLMLENTRKQQIHRVERWNYLPFFFYI